MSEGDTLFGVFVVRQIFKPVLTYGIDYIYDVRRKNKTTIIG